MSWGELDAGIVHRQYGQWIGAPMPTRTGMEAEEQEVGKGSHAEHAELQKTGVLTHTLMRSSKATLGRV